VNKNTQTAPRPLTSKGFPGEQKGKSAQLEETREERDFSVRGVLNGQEENKKDTPLSPPIEITDLKLADGPENGETSLNLAVKG